MMVVSGARAYPKGMALLTGGFRPFFLASGMWAVVAIGLWIPMYLGGLRLPTRFDPLTWHIHEMIFGFVMASVGGFLLTAIPNWTNRLPVSGRSLALLAGLWLLGRVACLVSAVMPAWLAVAADLSYPIALLGIATREIVAGRNWRNLPMMVPLAVFIVADLLMHLDALGSVALDGLGWRLALAAPIQLISAIGGRIIPSFTRNWLAKRAVAKLPAPHGRVDVAAIGFLHAGLLGWAFLPDSAAVGALLVTAALLNAWRLARWRGAATLHEPLLFVLHVGYGWVVAGSALLGLSMLTVEIPIAAAIHALTAGAIGTMILAVMTRATLGHTGRDLTASGATITLYVIAIASALVRVAAPWGGAAATALIALSGAFWVAAFLLFEIVYGTMLVTTRQRKS